MRVDSELGLSARAEPGHGCRASAEGGHLPCRAGDKPPKEDGDEEADEEEDEEERAAAAAAAAEQQVGLNSSAAGLTGGLGALW